MQIVDQLLEEAKSLQAKGAYADALAKLGEAEKLNSNRYEIFNIRGAIYLSLKMRDPERSRAELTKAQQLEPDALPPYFNLAELDFVTHRWAAAEESLEKMLGKFPKLPSDLHHFLLFKMLICRVKQSKQSQAQELLDRSFTFMDDTPAYYFGKAVLALDKQNTKAGNEWLAKAQVIFTKPQCAPFLDSLAEAGYVDMLSLGKPSRE